MDMLEKELRIYNDSLMTQKETPHNFKQRQSYVIKRGGHVVNIRAVLRIMLNVKVVLI
jgi:hypothetical protein